MKRGTQFRNTTGAAAPASSRIPSGPPTRGGRFRSGVELRGQLAERVAALRFLGVDPLAELMEVAGAQGGDFVLGGGEAVLQLRDLADQADQPGAHVFAGDGFGAPFVVVRRGLDPSGVASAVGGVLPPSVEARRARR
jgi:hypothetical protein